MPFLVQIEQLHSPIDRFRQIDLDAKAHPAAMAAALVAASAWPRSLRLSRSPPSHRTPHKPGRRQQRHERIGVAAIGGVERAGGQHHEAAAETRPTARHRAIARSPPRPAARCRAMKCIAPRWLAPKVSGVQQLQRRRRAEPGQDAHQAPAHDAGRAAQRHQPERPERARRTARCTRTARSRRRRPRPTRRRSPCRKSRARANRACRNRNRADGSIATPPR